jgi:hypothetical protein
MIGNGFNYITSGARRATMEDRIYLYENDKESKFFVWKEDADLLTALNERVENYNKSGEENEQT